jgi:hypothetical protein
VRHGQGFADVFNEGADKSNRFLFLPFPPARPTECQVGIGPRVPVPEDRPTGGNCEQEASQLVLRKFITYNLIDIPVKVGPGGRVRLLCEARTETARSFRALSFGLRWPYCVPSTRQQPEGSVIELWYAQGSGRSREYTKLRSRLPAAFAAYLNQQYVMGMEGRKFLLATSNPNNLMN